MGNRINPVYVGEIFEKLTTVEEIERRGKRGERIFKCRCECGNEIFVPGYTLRRGTTKSCGCLQKINCGKNLKSYARNGLSKKPEYAIWNGMKQRCHNPSNNGFINYGARGITVDPKWRESFEAFYYDVGPRPERGYQLDRIDNDKGYVPGNCRWVTAKDNANNKSNSVWLEIEGENHPLNYWLKKLNLSHSTYHKRLKYGFTPLEALFHKSGGYGARKRKSEALMIPIRQKEKVLLKIPDGKISIKNIIEILTELSKTEPATEFLSITKKGVVNLYIDYN